MTVRPPRRAGRALVAAVVLVLLLAAAAAPAAARAIDPGRSRIADSAQLAAGATAVHLEGAVRCRGCLRFTLGATVSQGTSGAVGQGGVRCICHSAEERWRLTARTREATRFRPGAARVCVWIIARGAAGRAIDARQWCENVELRLAPA